ncbi:MULTISPECIES: hypothetical protein [Acidihalobacter]|nr:MULTISPECIES: hypothetical protein [Acidihalobacter]
MANMYAFDTLATFKKLRSAGFTDTQAEALVALLSEVFRFTLKVNKSGDNAETQGGLHPEVSTKISDFIDPGPR